MTPCYVHSAISISAQDSLNEDQVFDDPIHHTENIIKAISPNYKEFISGGAARRMAPGVKMGVVASRLALDQAKIEMPEAIITGTGMGCVKDSEKFVSTIIDNDEQFLTPTSFIQSTHNTVGAQIALGLGCKSYNFTYVHSSNSFESSLIDAHMMLSAGEANDILVGGIDEHGDHTNKLHQLIGHIKHETIASKDLLNANSEGTIFGEGATFFVLSKEGSSHAEAKLLASEIYSRRNKEEVTGTIQVFLKENGLELGDIDAVVLGNNGDKAYDDYYHTIQAGIFKNTMQIGYKHLSGEFMTASAFGFWLGVKMIKLQKVPAACQLNSVTEKSLNTILLYNQYRGENHSLALIQRV